MEGARVDHVGYRSVELTVDDRRFPLAVLYPTDAPEETQRIGPYSIEAARDAAPKDGRFPLVMISHGRGGTPWVYRTLATHLARGGFIVAVSRQVLYAGRNADYATTARTAAQGLRDEINRLRIALPKA